MKRFLDANLVLMRNRLTGKFLLFLAWLELERILPKDHVPYTMKVLSDAKSLIMFQIIAASSPGGLRTTELNRDLRITLKQLYMRISSLVNAGLARRQGGRYFLTSYGKLMVASLEIMNKASSNFEKLVAIDSMEASNIANNMPEEERRKIVEILISNQQIKEILLLQRGKSQSSLDDDRIVAQHIQRLTSS
jgi:predicted transcriptional regulator